MANPKRSVTTGRTSVLLAVLLWQEAFEFGCPWVVVDSSRVTGQQSALCRGLHSSSTGLSDQPTSRRRPRQTKPTTTWPIGNQERLQWSVLHEASVSANVGSDFATVTTLPRMASKDLQFLHENRYVIVPNFLSESLQEALRNDVQELRSKSKFNIARIGQDATNTLNTDIRVAETCFVGPTKLADVPNSARSQLYAILDAVRQDLVQNSGNFLPHIKALDASLTELLYAYYPQGGFYRRHRDAVPGSASALRKISLLLYLNKDWKAATDGGQLRMHFDSGGDALPANEAANYLDVEPNGGTLVLFESDAIPHEVLDTVGRDRVAVVGWYNRPLAISDAMELGVGGSTDISPVRLALAAISLGLITVGVVNLIM